MNHMESLFEEWKRLLPAESGTFVEDGVISQEEWMRADKRILFLLKEVNDEKGKMKSIVNTIRNAVSNRESKIWKRPTFHNMGRWAHGLHHCSKETPPPTYKEADGARRDSLLSCALINLKKTAGGRVATKEVEQSAMIYSSLIKRQIEILKPDVIVFGGTYKMVKTHVLPELNKVAFRVHTYQDTVCINANHPACTKERREMFSQVVSSYHAYLCGQ